MRRIAIVHAAIDLPKLIAEVASTGYGATSVFLGTVRDNHDEQSVTGLEYSAYEPMAEKELDLILREAQEKFGVEAIVVEHRVGSLGIGDISVAIVASSAHRSAALDSTRYVIEEIKKRVPIWKLEHYVGGTREWVDPTRSTTPSAAI